MQAEQIKERIKDLEQEVIKLLPARRNELFNVIASSGGLSLSNELLAGFVLYAKDPSNKDSEFLKEIYALGKSKLAISTTRQTNLTAASTNLKTATSI